MWNAFDGIKAVRYSDEWPDTSDQAFTCIGSCVSWPNTNVLCDIAGTTAVSARRRNRKDRPSSGRLVGNSDE